MRIFAVVLAVMLMVGVAFADGDTIMKKVYSYGVTNTSGVAQTTSIPVTSIRPLVDKVIGYSLIPYNGTVTSEGYLGIFDGTDMSATAECFAENEISGTLGWNELWNYGKYISTGVTVVQGANTIVQIYFIRE